MQVPSLRKSEEEPMGGVGGETEMTERQYRFQIRNRSAVLKTRFNYGLSIN